ncbi:MAG TPA: chemotaxis protein CheX [Desulfobacteraceae bacterium]|nr:chemotaxis protein CheX [Desulfobacteraceae bacterium]
MKTELMTQVTNSIFEVMETMFFMTLEKPKSPPAEIGDAQKTSAITFSGEYSGTIFLSIPEGLLRTMTENLLGQDIDTLTQAHVDGTLKEALNMIAGSALTKVDNTAYMGLGIPEIVPHPEPGTVDDTVVLATTEGVFTAHVRLNSDHSDN